MNAPLRAEEFQLVQDYRRFYVSVRVKFVIALAVAIAWTTFSVYLAQAWMHDLAHLTHPLFALWALTFIAFVPGFMNAFLATSLAARQTAGRRASPYSIPASPSSSRPIMKKLASARRSRASPSLNLPSARSRRSSSTTVRRTGTVRRISLSHKRVQPAAEYHHVRLLDFEQNRGKAAVLNSGLAEASHDLVCTIDGDSRLRVRQPDRNRRALSCPIRPVRWRSRARCSSAIPAQPSITAAQEWDYFHGISAVKRMQSMYHGTLVAQGAFSLYRRMRWKPSAAGRTRSAKTSS